MNTEPFEAKGSEPLDIRFQLRLTKSQMEYLRAVAQDRGITVADVIREGIGRAATRSALMQAKERIESQLGDVERQEAARQEADARKFENPAALDAMGLIRNHPRGWNERVFHAYEFEMSSEDREAFRLHLERLPEGYIADPEFVSRATKSQLLHRIRMIDARLVAQET